MRKNALDGFKMRLTFIKIDNFNFWEIVCTFALLIRNKKIYCMGLKKISTEQVSLSIEPSTRMLCVKQGENVIKMTRDQVNGLRNLKEGKYSETNMYTSQIIPRNKFRLQPTGTVLVECVDEYNQATVLINSRGIKGILQYVDSNRGKIAWDREMRRR